MMDKKLTLSLDQGVIEKAKQYARSNNTSLSKLIESYLAALTKRAAEKQEITPLVEALSGVIEVPSDFDEKKAYKQYLKKKYQ